jgi:hypothetical protein
MEDIDGRIRLLAERLERRPAEQSVAPGVVGEVTAARGAVHPVSIEGGWMVDQPEPIAVGCDVDDRHLGHPAGGEWIGHAERRPGDRVGRDRDAAIARQEHLDRTGRRAGHLAEGPGESVHDVAEPAGLGPGLTFGSDRRDSERHRRIVACRARRRRIRRRARR